MTLREQIVHALGTGPRTSRSVSTLTGINLPACRALMSRMVGEKSLKVSSQKVAGIAKPETVYELTGFVPAPAVPKRAVEAPRRATPCKHVGIKAGPRYYGQLRWPGALQSVASRDGCGRTPVRGGMH